MSGMLKNVPIYAVMVEDLGERGAQYTALRLLQELHSTGAASLPAASVPIDAGRSSTEIAMKLEALKQEMRQKDAEVARRSAACPLPSHAALFGVLGLGFAAGALAMMLRRSSAP